MKAFLRGLRTAEVAITTAAFVVLIVVVFGDVVVRRVTGSGLIWAREVGVFANIVLTIIGIGVASAEGAHLRPRLLDRVVPPRWDRAMTRVQELLTAAAFATLCWIAVQVVAETIALDDRSTVLRWALWPVQLALPVAFGVGALRHLLFGLYLDLRPLERSEADVEAKP